MRWDMKKRKRLIYGLLAVVAVFMLLALSTQGPVQWLFMALTLVVLVGYVIVWAILWRCPHCGAMLGRMDDATHCKYCGKRVYLGEK